MRSLFAAALLIAGSPAFAAPATPAQLERETWPAFQNKRVSEIKALLAPDFVGVYADGTHDLARELRSLKEVTIQDYKLSPFDTHPVDADDQLLTYRADVRLLVGKRTIAERLWMASLWHREGGRWRCVYHTEIKAK